MDSLRILIANLLHDSQAIVAIGVLMLIIFVLLWRNYICPQREKSRDNFFQKIAQRYSLNYVKNSQECAGGLLRYNYGVFRTIEGILGGKTIKIEDTSESVFGDKPKFWQTEDDPIANTRCYVDGLEELVGSSRKSENTIISFLESKK